VVHDNVFVRWIPIDALVRNQQGDKVATGEAMVEFPRSAPAS